MFPVVVLGVRDSWVVLWIVVSWLIDLVVVVLIDWILLGVGVVTSFGCADMVVCAQCVVFLG